MEELLYRQMFNKLKHLQKCFYNNHKGTKLKTDIKTTSQQH